MPLLHSRRAPSFHEPMIVCCFVYGEHQVWFILRCLVDREGRKRVIVFGLVDLVDREGRGSLIVFGLVYFVLLG